MTSSRTNSKRISDTRGQSPRLCLILALWAISTYSGGAIAQPVVYSDAIDDAVIRRTDLGNDGFIDPAMQRLPDIIEMRLGAFAPTAPHVDRFSGNWNPAGTYLRLDLVVKGLINPPGPLALDDDSPVYDPFRHGPNPIFGWLEIDMDGDENTGGELTDAEFRYVGGVGRFGGVSNEPRFTGRVALRLSECDGDVATAPYVERSGEEFHIALQGEELEQITVLEEKPGGSPAIFEEGESWTLRGDFFHRAHGFRTFAFSCVSQPGRYNVEVRLLFKHDAAPDRTTISLVYPLTNAAAAALVSPSTPVEANDGCEDNQNSVEEGLDDLQFSAQFADPQDRLQPEFILIEGWEFNAVADHLNPAGWRLCNLVGTGYGSPQSASDRHIWTDVWPDPRLGDFDGNGMVNVADTALLNAYIALHDGEAGVDNDGSAVNGSLLWNGFSQSFCAYDTNYDGVVNASDAVVLGDMDLNLAVQLGDVDDLVEALLTPQVYTITHFGVLPHSRGDLNGDGHCDALDIQGFVSRLLTP